MNDTTTGRTPVEPTELIDMRTHLTVAMLASSQLDRKTRHVPDAPHLQEYLDQSLQSLVEDVERVDALVTRMTEEQHATTRKLPFRWLGFAKGMGALLLYALSGYRKRLEHRKSLRLIALFLMH